MKMKTYLMAPAMAAALLLAACNNDDDMGVDLSQPISLSFAPASMDGQATRATIGITGASFEKGDRVGLYMDGTGYANVLYTCQGTTGWTASSLLYWPDAGSYTFRAYYPYMETVTDAVSLPADQSTAEAFTQADRMWASTTRAATNGTISLTLNHQMSLIKLDVEDGEAISLNEIKGMTSAILGDMPSEGTWDLQTGAVSFPTNGKTISSIRPYMVDNGDGTLTYYALVMPGTVFEQGDKFFSLTDTGGTTYSYDLNIDGGFTAGASQYCDIDLTVHRTGITLSGFSVGNWTSGATGSGSVTMD